MYGVLGVTGHTGSAVARELLHRGQPVRVIVRSEAKASEWRDRGAEVGIASLADAVSLERALEGVKGLYALVPPNLQAADPLEYARDLVDTLCAALRSSMTSHVAFLSSVGAQHQAGTGPIRGLHYAEERLRTLPIHCTLLRAAYFMENTTSLIPVMQANGVLPCLFPAVQRIPMVATEDIGRTAAGALLTAPPATEIVELLGPEDYTMEQVAAAYSRALGRPVTPVRVPDEGVVPALTQSGMPGPYAELVREMSQGIERGLVAPEGGHREVRGSVTIDTFATRAASGQ